MSLSDKALVVRVKSSAWTARRYDRSTSQDLTDENGAARSAARVNQYLMAGADEELKVVNQVVRDARDFVESQTVPWDTYGGRLVTPFTWFHMQTKLREYHKKFNEATEVFVTNYPTNVLIAQRNLGKLYDPTLFPHQSAIASLFSFEIQPEALPLSSPNDPRYGMTRTELDELRASIERTVEERMDQSLELQWKRLRDEVARLNKSTGLRPDGTKPPIFETTVEKLRNTAMVLKEMNITDNSHINIICGDVIDALNDVGVDTLRNSETQRADVHKATLSVLKRIDGLLL